MTNSLLMYTNKKKYLVTSSFASATIGCFFNPDNRASAGGIVNVIRVAIIGSCFAILLLGPLVNDLKEGLTRRPSLQSNLREVITGSVSAGCYLAMIVAGPAFAADVFNVPIKPAITCIVQGEICMMGAMALHYALKK